MRRARALALAGALGLALWATGRAAIPASFSSPEQAATALVAANRSGDRAALLRLLGPAGAPLIESGDAVADRKAREHFVAAYEAAHRIEYVSRNSAVLVVGKEAWPMPIPLVHGSDGWHFDAAAGSQEILNRRIGRNELQVMEVCREYVRAQREYAALHARAHQRPVYAEHFMSREGQHDGLYWPTRPGESESPLGLLIAEARAAGYPVDTPSQGQPRPYHGYYFRILTRQGAHAPGGARSYIDAQGRMTGGFALLAFPATYADSGVMTFLISQDGILFEKNLGPQTEAIARKLDSYDPDASWRAP